MEVICMYICEYYQLGRAGGPVDATVGLRSKRDAIRHGHKTCRAKGYCGFHLLHKPNVAGIMPTAIEYHRDGKDRCKLCLPERPLHWSDATATGMYDRD